MFSSSKHQMKNGAETRKTSSQRSTVLSSKTKGNGVTEAMKTPQTDSLSRTKYNLRSPVSISKVPIRLEPKMGVPSKSILKHTTNENSKKCKPLFVSNKDKTNAGGIFAKTSLIHNNLTKKISHSVSKVVSCPEVEKEGKQQMRSRDMAKKLLPNKSMLKMISKSDLKLNEHPFPEEYESLKRRKISELPLASRMKKVTFSTMSVEELNKNYRNNEFRVNAVNGMRKRPSELNISGTIYKKSILKRENIFDGKEKAKCTENEDKIEYIDRKTENTKYSRAVQGPSFLPRSYIKNNDLEIKGTGTPDKKDGTLNSKVNNKFTEIFIDPSIKSNLSGSQVPKNKSDYVLSGNRPVCQAAEDVPSCQIFTNVLMSELSESIPSCSVSDYIPSSQIAENRSDFPCLVTGNRPVCQTSGNIINCQTEENNLSSKTTENIPSSQTDKNVRDFQLAEKSPKSQPVNIMQGIENSFEVKLEEKLEEKNNETCDDNAQNLHRKQVGTLHKLEAEHDCILKTDIDQNTGSEKCSTPISVRTIPPQSTETKSPIGATTKRELMERDINEKIKILTKQFLQDIKEKRNTLPKIYKLGNSGCYGRISSQSVFKTHVNDTDRNTVEKSHDVGGDILDNTLKFKNGSYKTNIESNKKQNSFEITAEADSPNFNTFSGYRDQDIKQTPRFSKIPRFSQSPKSPPALLLPLDPDIKVERSEKTNEKPISEFNQNLEGHKCILRNVSSGKETFTDRKKENDIILLEKHISNSRDELNEGTDYSEKTLDCEEEKHGNCFEKVDERHDTIHHPSESHVKSIHDAENKISFSTNTKMSIGSHVDNTDKTAHCEDAKSVSFEKVQDGDGVKSNNISQTSKDEKDTKNHSSKYIPREKDRKFIYSNSAQPKLCGVKNIFKILSSQGMWPLFLGFFLILILLLLLFIM